MLPSFSEEVDEDNGDDADVVGDLPDIQPSLMTPSMSQLLPSLAPSRHTAVTKSGKPPKGPSSLGHRPRVSRIKSNHIEGIKSSLAPVFVRSKVSPYAVENAHLDKLKLPVTSFRFNPNSPLPTTKLRSGQGDRYRDIPGNGPIEIDLPVEESSKPLFDHATDDVLYEFSLDAPLSVSTLDSESVRHLRPAKHPHRPPCIPPSASPLLREAPTFEHYSEIAHTSGSRPTSPMMRAFLDGSSPTHRDSIAGWDPLLPSLTHTESMPRSGDDGISLASSDPALCDNKSLSTLSRQSKQPSKRSGRSLRQRSSVNRSDTSVASASAGGDGSDSVSGQTSISSGNSAVDEIMLRFQKNLRHKFKAGNYFTYLPPSHAHCILIMFGSSYDVLQTHRSSSKPWLNRPCHHQPLSPCAYPPTRCLSQAAGVGLSGAGLLQVGEGIASILYSDDLWPTLRHE